MNLSPIDLIIVGLYFLVVLFIGFQTARRIKNADDFSVAGRRLIWPVVFSTLAATFLGGGATLGRAGESYEVGYAFMVAAIAFPVQTVITGWFVAPRLNSYTKSVTIGDVFDLHSGKAARLIVGVLGLLVTVGILGAQGLALGSIFQVVFGIDSTLGIVIGMGIVLVYSTAGGMWADVQTDVFQFVLLGLFLPVALLVGVFRAGGPTDLIERIPDTHLDFFGAYGFWEFAAIFVAFALGEALIPPYAQRALAAQNPLSARKGYARAGAFGLVFYFVSASLGIVALVFYPNIRPDDAIPTIIIDMLPVGIAGLVAASLVAVIMSTADSLLNSASVILSNDLVKGFIAPNISGRNLLWVERSSNFLIGFGALLFALNAETIVDALMLTYGLWGPTVVAPFVFAVMSKRRAPVAIVASMLTGATVAIVWTFVLGAPNDINAIIVALPVNIAVLACTYMFIDRPKNIQTEVGKVVTS